MVYRARSLCLLLLVALLLFVSACSGRRGQTVEDIPTPASFEGLATAQYLTQVAPPEGFRESVAFPEIDANLNLLAGGRYTVYLDFQGVFSRTPRPTNAAAAAEVWFNQVGSSRRIVAQITGEMLGRQDNSFEAVRLGPDPFLVQNGECLKEGPDAQAAASLRAGTLIGGVKQAVPGAKKAVINGVEVYLYTFATTDLNLPAVQLAEGGTITASSGELWVAPQHNAVVRFYVNLDVTNAIIFGRALPVDGTVIIRYDLYDIGQTTNISVPNGC
jgi:hypothetical protein